MGGFFSSLFGGQNKTLNNDINQAGDIAGFGTGVGKGDIGTASSFWQDILGGDESKISRLLAPEIKNIQDQGQEKLKTTAQFGNRSGGTNAAGQRSTDDTRAAIDNMVSGLTGEAASKIGELGTSTLGIGLDANKTQASESQQRMRNWLDSIFGSGISSGLGELEGLGLGKL